MKQGNPSEQQDFALASRIMRTFRENVTHRATSGADKVLQTALDAWACVPSPEDVRLFQSMGVLPSTYDSLTRVKLVQIMSILNRVFGQVTDKSWGLTSSPDPTLPVDVQAEIVMKYAQEGLKLAQLSGIKDPDQMAQYASTALKANEKQIDADRMAFANERAKRQERVIDDILFEAGFTINVVRQFLNNLVKLGTGLIIGPCEEPIVSLKLSGTTDTVAYKPVIEKAVRFMVPSTMDVYPSPGMIEADDADLCVVMKYPKAELARAAAGKTGGPWRVAAIREILKLYPNGVDVSSSNKLTDSTERRAQLAETPGTTKRYEAVRWFGFASGEELKEVGITKDGTDVEITEDSYYDAEVVVLAGKIIYSRVCDPAIGRPVVKTTFYGDSVQFFGWPPSAQIENEQKLMNLAMAALKKQLQLGGLVPLLVNDASSFVDADRPGAFALAPGKVFLRNINAFSQAGQQGQAIQPLNLPNLIREIIALFDAIAKLTDDASGFNRNMLGSGNYAGAARTATGLMQIQEASNIVPTFVIGNVDATAIVPMLKKCVAWANRNHPDKRAKGDPQVVPRGQLSKVMKSSQQQIISAGFQATQAGVMPQLLGPEKLLGALREYLKSIDFPNADKLIPDEDRVAWLTTMADSERSLKMLTEAQGMEQGQPGQTIGQPTQPQPQAAQKDAGLGMESGVEARRGAA